jgi:chaperonin GroEL (HSP60 family)
MGDGATQSGCHAVDASTNSGTMKELAYAVQRGVHPVTVLRGSRRTKKLAATSASEQKPGNMRMPSSRERSQVATARVVKKATPT